MILSLTHSDSRHISKYIGLFLQSPAYDSIHEKCALLMSPCYCRCCSCFQCLEILVTLRRDLERRRLLKVPLVYISPSLGNETQRLREYVRRLQANLAESPGEAGGNHCVDVVKGLHSGRWDSMCCW